MKTKTLLTWIILLTFTCRLIAQEGGKPLCVTAMKQLSDTTFALACREESSIRIYDKTFRAPLAIIQLPAPPTGLVIKNGLCYVTTFDNARGKLHVVDPQSKQIQKTVAAGSGAGAPLFSDDAKKLYILNQFANTVSEFEVATLQCQRTFQVLRAPKAAVIGKEGRYLYINNFLPAQRADVDTVAACVSVIDLITGTRIKDIQLSNGSNALRGIARSSDGKYVFVTHNLGRFQVPTTQLQQGWMNTSAMSVIDTETLSFCGSVLLDEPEQGAAGIWGIQCTPEQLIISHSGTHELSLIDYPRFLAAYNSYVDKKALAYDLRFLYGLRTRHPLPGNSPRDLILSDNQVVVPTFFSDTIHTFHLADRTWEAYPLVANRAESPELKGEKYFNDATYCFQQWQSCNGCHPDDARTDGMNWDLMNDGMGNAKNCKSMLYAHMTPPAMISGIRPSAEVAVRKGFAFIQFVEMPESYVQCVDAYLRSLRPVESPYLVDGALSEKARRGEKVFEKLNCNSCHSGPLFTDLKMYRIGEGVEFEKGWDTPTLIEVWRTAPYLFDGRAATLQELFEVHKHGIEKKISKREIEELTEYVNSL